MGRANRRQPSRANVRGLSGALHGVRSHPINERRAVALAPNGCPAPLSRARRHPLYEASTANPPATSYISRKPRHSAEGVIAGGVTPDPRGRPWPADPRAEHPRGERGYAWASDQKLERSAARHACRGGRMCERHEVNGIAGNLEPDAEISAGRACSLRRVLHKYGPLASVVWESRTVGPRCSCGPVIGRGGVRCS
jgi:hypothetical protein